MRSSETIAAIDIGSNAIRLVIGELDLHHDVHVIKKIREPVRLGKDVFAEGKISKKTTDRALETFHKFQVLLKAHGVRQVKAVATSALREAKNREDFVREVQATCGLKIDVIDGREEARLICSAVSHRLSLSDRVSLLIDIGGGSVELTVNDHGRVRGLETFKLGTVRILQLMEEKSLKERHLREFLQTQMEPVKKFLRETIKDTPVDFCIGTGGNFECLGKLRVALLQKNSIYSMTYQELGQLVEHLEGMSLKERIQFLRLRPDRADVIVPAAILVHLIMGLANVERLCIPYVGLRDGILAEMVLKN